MNEKYLLLGLNLLLTLLPLAVLGALGADLIKDGFALEAIFKNMSLDTLMLAVVCQMFALVFGLNALYQAWELGLLPGFSKTRGKAAGK